MRQVARSKVEITAGVVAGIRFPGAATVMKCQIQEDPAECDRCSIDPADIRGIKEVLPELWDEFAKIYYIPPFVNTELPGRSGPAERKPVGPRIADIHHFLSRWPLSTRRSGEDLIFTVAIK